MNAWRDIDSDRRQIGFNIWATGGEIRFGKRLWRWRYVR